jgi:ABC-type Mn2+/Zn2+ transport system permease subunit
LGPVAALLVGAVLVWLLEERARAATEAMIGVVFSAALAVGSLTTSGDELKSFAQYAATGLPD